MHLLRLLDARTPHRLAFATPQSAKGEFLLVNSGAEDHFGAWLFSSDADTTFCDAASQYCSDDLLRERVTLGLEALLSEIRAI
jgi:hypothetical protein